MVHLRRATHERIEINDQPINGNSLVFPDLITL